MAYVSVIVPVYNQAETLLPFYYNLVKQLPEDFELIYVNDGSTDATEAELTFLVKKDTRVRCINLTKHFGNAAAVITGMGYATGTYVIVMKGSLHYPAHLIPEMINLLEAGHQIVNTSLSNKKAVNRLLRGIMDVCYGLLKRISAENKNLCISEFRGYHNRVIDQFRAAHEKNLMPGLFFNWRDYTVATISYEKKAPAGKDVRYTAAHLYREAKKAIFNSKASWLYSLVLTGTILLTSGLFIIGNQLFAQKPDANSQVVFLPVAALLIATGAWLFAKSTYRYCIIKELRKLYSMHQSEVKCVLDGEHLLRVEYREYKKAGRY
ncbi:MAG: glycosyltransferase [Lacibacter sp.]|jgi:dolichol-phosphate mannosyltransferase